MVSKLLNKKQHKVHHAIKQTINTLFQLKVDIVLNVKTNVCENQRQVLKWKNKGKKKESTLYDDKLLKLFPAKWLDTPGKKKKQKNKIN